MKISLSEIEAIRADLSQLEPPLNAVREMPIKEVIMTLAPELQAMVSRGYTTEGLLAELKKRKISITGRSLNCYLKEFKDGPSEGRKRCRKTSAVADSPAPPSAAVQPKTGNLFTPSEEKKVVPAAPVVPVDESWREEPKDLV